MSTPRPYASSGARPRRRGARMPRLLRALVAAGLLALGLPAGSTAADANRATAVPGVRLHDLDPQHWIARLPAPHQVILDRAGIQAQNARMRATDPSIHDLATLPDPLPRAFVHAHIEALSKLPAYTLHDAQGRPLAQDRLATLRDGLALDAIPARRPLRHGLVVRRADLRSFPTAQRVFSSPGDTDIDRFQESALFPGDAVAVLHASRDGQWLFVASERYVAWIEARHVATGARETVLGYAGRTPYVVVTGARVRTTHTAEEPRVSDLQLDMGLRLPLRTDLPPEAPVHGQHPYASHVVDLPARRADGHLEFVPALVPRSTDVAAGYLPLTAANLVSQAFKFLGERYGWGHAYEARDCSGFVSEVYRSFGILLPRNTGDQATSPALARTGFSAGGDAQARMAAVRGLQAGDLVYVPGHVMLTLGQQDGLAYVIHDIHGGGWKDADGRHVRAGFNGVVVTPLQPLLLEDGTPHIERMTAIQRIGPPTTR